MSGCKNINDKMMERLRRNKIFLQTNLQGLASLHHHNISFPPRLVFGILYSGAVIFHDVSLSSISGKGFHSTSRHITSLLLKRDLGVSKTAVIIIFRREVLCKSQIFTSNLQQ